MAVSRNGPKYLLTGPADNVPTTEFSRAHRYARTLAPVAGSDVHEPWSLGHDFEPTGLPHLGAWLVRQNGLTLPTATPRKAPPKKISVPAIRLAKPWVSVVIARRDNERTIDTAVKSLVDQDLPRHSQITPITSPAGSTGSCVAVPGDPRLAIRETQTLIRALTLEYPRSTRGCMYFVHAHTDCPSAKRRKFPHSYDRASMSEICSQNMRRGDGETT